MKNRKPQIGHHFVWPGKNLCIPSLYTKSTTTYNNTQKGKSQHTDFEILHGHTKWKKTDRLMKKINASKITRCLICTRNAFRMCCRMHRGALELVVTDSANNACAHDIEVNHKNWLHFSWYVLLSLTQSYLVNYGARTIAVLEWY